MMPSLQKEQSACPECSTLLVGGYCHQCGAKLPDEHDLALKHFLHDGLDELTHLDSKIFRTLRALFFRPGFLSAEYFAGRKLRYVLPLRLFLVAFALNLFLYTRPGVALYDVRFLISASPQGKQLEGTLEKAANKRHMTKEVLFERFNEHWQHDVSLFELGDVVFFALFLSLLIRRRYLVKHLVFSLHTLSFSILFGSLGWLYYARFGFRLNPVLIAISFAVLLFYLSRAISTMYGTTGRKAWVKSFVMLMGLQLSRSFLLVFTLILALFQTLRAH